MTARKKDPYQQPAQVLMTSFDLKISDPLTAIGDPLRRPRPEECKLTFSLPGDPFN